jgi:endonuclease G
MVNLRRNHNRASTGTLRLFYVLLIFGIVLFFLLYKGKPLIDRLLNKSVLQTSLSEDRNQNIVIEPNMFPEKSNDLLYHPERKDLPSYSGELLEYDYFTISFSPKYKQAEWAAWELTKESLSKPNVRRKTFFSEDKNLRSATLSPFDYQGSGYQRGHLVPAADVAFDTASVAQSHYMTNISPQKRGFNNGIWRELEQNTRDWAWKYNKVYVVTGPVFIEPVQYMKSGVAKPNSFFRVILTKSAGQFHGVGFVIANDLSDRHLSEYIKTIDEVEFITKFDFYKGLLRDQDEEAVETTVNPDMWPVNPKAFELRKNKWNYE